MDKWELWGLLRAYGAEPKPWCLMEGGFAVLRTSKLGSKEAEEEKWTG